MKFRQFLASPRRPVNVDGLHRVPGDAGRRCCAVRCGCHRTRRTRGHTTYANSGTSQVRDAIDEYLITGKTPPPNTVLPN